MNERIKELAGQKAEYWMNHYDRKSLADMELLRKDIEKFTELLILDCIKVCKLRAGNSDYNTGRMHCASDIAEYFGMRTPGPNEPTMRENILAGAEIHSDKGYRESTWEEAEAFRKKREGIKE